LTGAELSGETFRAPDASEQFGVDLADEAEREREGSEAVEAVVHRADVVDDFADVIREIAGAGVEFKGEDIFQGTLSALDLRTVDRLSPDVHCDEEIRVRECLRQTVEAAHGLIGTGEQRHQ